MKRLFWIYCVVAGFVVYWLGCKGKTNLLLKKKNNSPFLLAPIPMSNTSFLQPADSLLWRKKMHCLQAIHLKHPQQHWNWLLHPDSLASGPDPGRQHRYDQETASKFIPGTIVGSATALAGETSWKIKGKNFANTADALWTLIRTVKYSGEL